MTSLKGQMPANYATAQKKRVPPEQTNAEQSYYLKQMTARTPMVVKLVDGEEIQGVIEWYDKGCIKVNRDDGPNLLIPKHSIKYLFKQDERRRKHRGEPPTGGSRRS